MSAKDIVGTVIANASAFVDQGYTFFRACGIPAADASIAMGRLFREIGENMERMGREADPEAEGRVAAILAEVEAQVAQLDAVIAGKAVPAMVPPSDGGDN